eukprot:5037781-Amphidinium_carterae.2
MVRERALVFVLLDLPSPDDEVPWQPAAPPSPRRVQRHCYHWLPSRSFTTVTIARRHGTSGLFTAIATLVVNLFRTGFGCETAYCVCKKDMHTACLVTGMLGC